jgi:hypothetical protein
MHIDNFFSFILLLYLNLTSYPCIQSHIVIANILVENIILSKNSNKISFSKCACVSIVTSFQKLDIYAFCRGDDKGSHSGSLGACGCKLSEE